MPKILIGGANGSLGRDLILVAAGRGYDVVALVRKTSAPQLADLQRHISEIRFAEFGDPVSLSGICKGIDIVITTIGHGHRIDGKSHDQVDYQANKSLLEEAKRAGVRKFGYVSVICAETAAGIPLADAKRKFELTLIDSGIGWIIFRPSGYFKDILTLYRMAEKGRIVLFGDGEILCTPIGTNDLADIILDRMGQSRVILDIGGPETLTWNDLARISFESQGKKTNIKHLPVWILVFVKGLIRLVRPKAYPDFQFVAYIMRANTNAPEIGTTTLRQYFDALSKS